MAQPDEVVVGEVLGEVANEVVNAQEAEEQPKEPASPAEQQADTQGQVEEGQTEEPHNEGEVEESGGKKRRRRRIVDEMNEINQEPVEGRKRVPKRVQDYADIAGEAPKKRRTRKVHSLIGLDESTEIQEGEEMLPEEILDGSGEPVSPEAAGKPHKRRGPVPGRKRGSLLPAVPGARARAKELRQQAAATAAMSGNLPFYTESTYQLIVSDFGARLSVTDVLALTKNLIAYEEQPKIGVIRDEYLGSQLSSQWRIEQVRLVLALVANAKNGTVFDDTTVSHWSSQETSVNDVLARYKDTEWWKESASIPAAEAAAFTFWAKLQILQTGGILLGASDTASLLKRWSALNDQEKLQVMAISAQEPRLKDAFISAKRS